MHDCESDRSALHRVKAQHRGVIGIEEGIAVEHEHGFFACLGEREANGAAGAEGNALDHIVNCQPVKSRTEVLLNDCVLVANGEQNASAAGTSQLGEQDFKKGTAGNGRHGLGQAVKARRKPRAEPTGKNNGFHRDSAPGRGGLRGKVAALDEQGEDVLESQMRLLDVHGDLRGHAQAVVAERRHFAAGVSC